MADNFLIKDATGTTITVRSKDVGLGVESSITIPGDASGNIAWGTAGTANPNVMTIQGIASGTVVPISGTITANAGSNLNTSLLALESGGNLATLSGIVTSSRAAVNPISGQTGVQGGAGVTTALTQRVAIATDANAISGTVTVIQPTGTNLHVVVDSGTISTTGSNSYTHISTATTTNGIKSGAGTLVAIVINQTGTVASLITIYDNTTATGTVIAIIDGLSRTGNYDYNVAFSTGLSIVTTGTAAPDITVVWR